MMIHKKWLLLLFVIMTTESAKSHSYLLDSVPAKGETLAESANEITLSFSGPIEIKFSSFYLQFPCRKKIALTPANVAKQGEIIHLTIPLPLAKGNYQVTWNIFATDGHRQRSSMQFQVK